MPVTFVKRSTLPAPVKGKAGSLSVVVTKNGQIQLSKMSHDFISGKHLVIGFEAGKVYLFRTDSKLVKGVDTKDYVTLSNPKKGGGAYFSASGILDHAKEFGAGHVYPFRQSGNQSFSVTKDEKNGCLIFEVPEKAMTPKPVVKRTKKIVAAGTAATPGATSGTPVNGAAQPVGEEELTLA